MTAMSRKEAAELVRSEGRASGDGALDFDESEEVYVYTETYVMPDGHTARLRWRFEPLEVKRRGRILDSSEYPFGNGTAECIDTDDPGIELVRAHPPSPHARS